MTLSQTADILAKGCYIWARKKLLRGHLREAWRDLRLGVKFTRKARRLRKEGK